jgi:MFS-type transporter involved in bile tolerance (Atg22 family)
MEQCCGVKHQYLVLIIYVICISQTILLALASPKTIFLYLLVIIYLCTAGGENQNPILADARLVAEELQDAWLSGGC